VSPRFRIAAALLAGATLLARPAAADKPPPWSLLLRPIPTSGDSPRVCAEIAAAERERRAHQPITEMDVYRGMGDALPATLVMTWAAFVPTLGLQLRRGSRAPSATLSWPGSIPVGPTTACRFSSSGNLQELRSLRVVLEPGVVVRSPVSLFLRPGLRAIWHRSAWRIGVGAGLGATLLWADRSRFAPSISPELLLHVGRCCGPGYLLVSLRADHYAGREPDSAAASLSFTFW
jgi:hypothetical protein